MLKTIALILMLASSNAFATATEPSPFEGRHEIKPIVYTECQAGHVFVIAASRYGVSMMQVFQDTDDMVPKPIECGKKDED